MYVCVCNGVTERAIREAARAGAATLDALRAELGVAAGCGQCADCACEVMCEARRARELEPAMAV